MLSFLRMNPGFAPEEDPGLDGPDYVALVIEWDDEEVTTVAATPHRLSTLQQTVVTVAGALAALAFASWGLRRLRAA